MTKEEAFDRYTEDVALIEEQAKEAIKNARSILRERLKVLRITHHEELKAIRVLEQKTKRGK